MKTKEIAEATEFQILLAIIALTPAPEEGPRLPLPVALARLDRFRKKLKKSRRNNRMGGIPG